jgi:hypothetical protein
MTDQEILDAMDAKIKASEKIILETISSKLAEIGDRVIKEISTG